MNISWLGTTFYWYLYLLVIGLVFFPITKQIFSIFRDKGYAFSKTIAILLLTYASFIGGVARLVPFTRISLFVLLGISAVINFLIFRQRDRENISLERPKSKKAKHHKPEIIEKKKWWKNSTVMLIIFEEILFLLSLIFLAYVRAQEPSIRGLEKFMDFGFMNSIMRSKYFPPLDMWLSADPTHPGGYPINYYYFGHMTGALLIKLSGVQPFMGYNLILATIFAQSMTMIFALVTSIVNYVEQRIRPVKPIRMWYLVLIGLIGTYIVNLGGNLHTIYAFTSGYPNDNPIPFWQILSKYNPTKYWYPNATRFIPFTIHEFPSYSYVVADLHGHVFDIPFVIVTLGFFFVMLVSLLNKPLTPETKRYSLLSSIFLGFMLAVHYMTNAFDGPIYLLLTAVFLFSIFKLSKRFFALLGTVVASFWVFSFPFSFFFAPFASGVGVNCVPQFVIDFLDKHKNLNYKIGPFLFLKENCQVSPPWMLFVLWGFFWICFFLFVVVIFLEKKNQKPEEEKREMTLETVDFWAFVLFAFSTFLLLIPEFFYAKDIYPAHFRANTMFKLGYQAFMMMGISSAYLFYRLRITHLKIKYVLKAIFLFFFFFIAIYPFFAFPSYYGSLLVVKDKTNGCPFICFAKQPELNGATWLKSSFPEDLAVINYFNQKVSGQPIILEAQGDSYTDFERISAYTGLPTIAGWWVHEWLWRGSPDVVGKRIPDISLIYESDNVTQTEEMLKKYNVEYVVVSNMERSKYPKLIQRKFDIIGTKVFETDNKLATVYKLK